MNLAGSILASLPLLALAACASTPATTAEPSAADPGTPRAASTGSAAPGAPQAPSAASQTGYTLVLIRTGPRSEQLSADENGRAFEGHFANMGRMAREGQLVLAGPYGEVRHAPDLRGIFVLDTSERAKAEAWAATDPTTQAGVFQLEFHDITTDAALRRALAEDLAWRARQEAAGKKLQPGEGARGYALLTAEDSARAWRELAPQCGPGGGVLLLAHLDGTRVLALLDAESAAEARERFAPQLENMGACTIDDWFGSKQFARLPELAAMN